MDVLSTLVGIMTRKAGKRRTVGVILMIATLATVCPIDSINI